MITAKKRFKVLERDNFRCQYCGKNGKDVSLEIDHIIPKSKGGTDEIENLITCCRECNSGKGNEVIGVSNGMAKIRISDHENLMIKKFFSEWNNNGFGTIDKTNLTFLSGFIKLFYGKPLTKIIEEDEILVQFNEGGKICESKLKEFDGIVWDYTLLQFLKKIGNQSLWNTQDNNLKLNYLITERMLDIGLPISFNFKYSLFPKMIEEWKQQKIND